MEDNQLRYFRLLAGQYPSIQAASNAIISLSAQLQLPKGTEHFLSDIHGEHEAFAHVIKNGAGSTWRKIEELFSGELKKKERRDLAALIYYPEQKLPLILNSVQNQDEWLRNTLIHLIKLCRQLVSKYRRETVRSYLPGEMARLIEELLYENEDMENKSAYYRQLLDEIVATGSASVYIISLAELIQRLAISRLHVIGDIYDRGPGAHKIIDRLMEFHQVDIQWGNHDILWMGAAAGNEACMANVVRICLRYGNLETLENAYGISLLPLASFTLETYKADPCDTFMPRVAAKGEFTTTELKLMAQMQKAIAIIQFKLEGQIIKRRPHYKMEDRLVMEQIKYQQGTMTIDGTEYKLIDSYLPTVDAADPYALTEAERLVVDKLKIAFTNSKKLQQHVRFLFAKGSIYRIHDGNLLYHGCISLNDDGSFRQFNVDGQNFSGKAFLDRVDRLARQGYFAATNTDQKQYGVDAIWFLWCAPMSPLFGKDKMTTFERYFIAEPEAHIEKRNAYYALRDKEETAAAILKEFGLNPRTGHIINGHVPVKVKKGERPVKANGRLIVIDGGFSRAYRRQTGTAGYTLISNSRGLLLAAHRPIESLQKAISEGIDIESETEIIETHPVRMKIKDTDEGKAIQEQIEDLKRLVSAYKTGLIKELS